jgi:hypothetical protein
MLRQYSQFLIKSEKRSLGIFKKYSSALNFLISAYERIGAIIKPITTITIIEMIAVTLEDVIFCSA